MANLTELWVHLTLPDDTRTFELAHSVLGVVTGMLKLINELDDRLLLAHHCYRKPAEIYSLHLCILTICNRHRAQAKE